MYFICTRSGSFFCYSSLKTENRKQNTCSYFVLLTLVILDRKAALLSKQCCTSPVLPSAGYFCQTVKKTPTKTNPGARDWTSKHREMWMRGNAGVIHEGCIIYLKVGSPRKRDLLTLQFMQECTNQTHGVGPEWKEFQYNPAHIPFNNVFTVCDALKVSSDTGCTIKVCLLFSEREQKRGKHTKILWCFLSHAWKVLALCFSC